MPAGNSESPEQSDANASSQPESAAPAPSSHAQGTRPPRRRRFRTLGLSVLGLLLVGGLGLVGAEYYTSRPQFCGTCHIMSSYYQSWSHDKHGTKTDARCVDCHYAPGQQHTLQAKFKGLSQVASYFSGRYGAARPRAFVADASCLRSRCHGDGAYLAESLLIGEPRVEQRLVGTVETEVKRNPTVRFVHEKHLRVDARLAETEAQLAEVRARVERGTPPETRTRIAQATRSILPSPQREAQLTALLSTLGQADLATDALEWQRLEHLRMRLSQAQGLSCTACHAYDDTGQHHLQLVDLHTCYTCHFFNQAFNRDTGECLKCHEPPARQILVHGEPATLTFEHPATATAGAVGGLMDHRDIVSRGIDCESCHADVVQGQATVAARDCQHCHDQSSYLDGFTERDTAKVAEYHRAHVPQQRAHCLDCHRAVRHALVNALEVGTSATFLEPVLNNCQHCHPRHHAEQVELLMGIGGAGVSRPMPNAMFGSRINCLACHTTDVTDAKGDELIKATQATCVACHGADYARLFEQWTSEIKAYVAEAEAALARTDNRVDELRSRGRDLPSDATRLIDQARFNLRFVRAGNGVHNKNFAMELLDLTLRNLDEAQALLSQLSGAENTGGAEQGAPTS